MAYDVAAGSNKIFFAGDSVPNTDFRFTERFVQFCLSHQVRVFNLEGAFSFLKEPAIKAGPHILLDEKCFSRFAPCFNVAVLANNHTMDFGPEGLEATKYICGRHDMRVVGAGSNEDQAFAPLDLFGLRIIAVAENEFGGAGPDRPGIATVENESKIFRLINDGKRDGRRVIVVSHGGSEVIPIPPPYIRARFRLWVEYGADLVIGNHPHVVQGFEKYHGKPVFYSLGNFAFKSSDFSAYPNSGWSVGVTFDIANGEADIVHISADDSNCIDICEDLPARNEFERLSRLLEDNEYVALYDTISSKLYPIWYSRLMAVNKEDAALLLHYIRCDAHRNMIESSLSRIIGEKNQIALLNNKVAIKENSSDAVIVHTDLIAFYKANMQMLPAEIEYLEKLLTLKNKLYLEIGSGYSTLYFRGFVKKMISVETRKDWFDVIDRELRCVNADNVELVCVPPEKCAFDETGREKCVSRVTPSGNISDYGEKPEYSTYLARIAELLDSHNFDVILVDGQVRKEVIEIIIEKGFAGELLLHDVTPEREYLNQNILSMDGLRMVAVIESLVHLAIEKDGIKSSWYNVNIVGTTGEKAEYEMIFESDWLASNPLFYNEVTGKYSHNINDVIENEDIAISPEGLFNYLDFGYSVFEHTPVKNVRMLRHSSRFYSDRNGGYRIEYLEDPVWRYLGKASDENDVLEMILGKVREWENTVSGEIIIPTSGGYDSRLLNYFIEDKSRIRSFTYGISLEPDKSFEVVIAKRLSELLETRWEMIPLGEFNRYLDVWNSLFGVSTHAHGMYHIEFYNKISSTLGRGELPLLSGIIGDVWAGVFIPEINCQEDLRALGFTHGLRMDPSVSPRPRDFPIRRQYWETHKELLKDPSFRVVEAMRRKMALLCYLYRVPRFFGFKPWSPFLDLEVATAMLNLPEDQRRNRMWQKRFFGERGLDLENCAMEMDYSNVLDLVSIFKHPVPLLNVELLHEHVDSDIIKGINMMLETCLSEEAVDYGKLLQAYYAYVIIKPVDFVLSKKYKQQQ
jgi:hypothetical protein